MTQNNLKSKARASRFEPGKIQCLECGGWYHVPLRHVRQTHRMTGLEYKIKHGLDKKRGLMSDITRKVMHDHAFKTGTIEKLKKAGKKHWFKKGDKQIGRYKRSAQTMKRLTLLGMTGPRPSRKPRVEITCATCGEKKSIRACEVGKNNYCNRSCSTVARNKAQRLSTTELLLK